MQGFRQRGGVLRRSTTTTGELQLRKSVIWSSPSPTSAAGGGAGGATTTRGSLQERLEELLVLELHKDGGRSFLTFTVRGLYKHVLTAITAAGKKRERDEVRYTMIGNNNNNNNNKGGLATTTGAALLPPRTATTLGATMAASSPIVLGALSAHQEEEEESVDDENNNVQEKESELSDSRKSETRNNQPRILEEIGISRLPQTIPKPTSPVERASSYADRQVTGKAENVTYRDRLGGYLHPRDMRRLVTPFSASNEPGFIVRRHVMLLNFDPMRAVILRDRLLVIIPDGADSILAQLEKRVRGGILEMERSFLGGTSHGSDDDIGQSGHSSRSGRKRRFVKNLQRKSSAEDSPLRTGKEPDATSEVNSDAGTASTQAVEEFLDATDNNNDDGDDEWHDLQGTEWIDLPFELQCTDAVLHTVSAFLSEDTLELQEASTGYITRILKDKTGAQDDPLTIIRAIKEAVREMSGRVKGFVQSMNRILDEDEDMALMNLTRLRTHPERFCYPVSAEVLEEESDEPELILESYLQEGLSLVNVLDSIQGQIETAAELVDQRLDSVRNRILMANMVLTAMSVSLSVASLVGSLFGMNVPNSYEDDEVAFRKIVFGTIAGAIGICSVILVTLHYSGTMPQMGLSTD